MSICGRRMTKSKLKWRPLSITKFLALSAISLTAINILIVVAMFSFNLRKEWFLLFNMDKEMNIPTLFASLLLIFCAVLIGIDARKIPYKSKDMTKRAKKLIFRNGWDDCCFIC